MKVKVLIIDDEVGFTKLLKLNLEMNGEFQVCIENDSTNAQATALKFSPDVILIDIVMPGIAGDELAVLFKDDPYLKDIPMIMITALSGGEGANHTKFGGSVADLVLPKPLRNDLLKSSIMKVLSGRAKT